LENSKFYMDVKRVEFEKTMNNVADMVLVLFLLIASFFAFAATYSLVATFKVHPLFTLAGIFPAMLFSFVAGWAAKAGIDIRKGIRRT